MLYHALYLKTQKMLVRCTLPLRRRRLRQLVDAGLPTQLLAAIEVLLVDRADAAALEVAQYAEAKRAQIAARGHQFAEVWYSPKPGSADNSPDRPQPGKVLDYSLAKAAYIGKNRVWATALHLISRDYHCSHALELGSCVGISAVYLAKHAAMQRFITVEGSASLSAVASQTLQDLPQATVLNTMFDDAIDQLLIDGQSLDLAYIDGHHEKVATLHYLQRLIPLLKPGAIVIFDDISWSADMRQAWHELSKNPLFGYAADFGAIGVCQVKTNVSTTLPDYWDLQPIIGQYPIGQPHGWKD